MNAPKLRAATYAELEALPPGMVGEITFGVLQAHPRPSPRHSRAAKALGYETAGPFDLGSDGPGGWIFLDEPELHLGPHVLVPDLAGWRAERLTPFPDTPLIEAAPDWVAEILSPSTQKLDRTDKLSIYAEFRVGHCWYVDPGERTLEVFETAGTKWLLAAMFNDSDPVCAPPFAAHTFGLDRLWV